MSSSTYGDGCYEFYDEIYGPPRAIVVRTLTKFARGGSALELGLGTGRTALALLQSGLEVTGIESSAGMLAQLRRKPEAVRIRVVEGDFAAIRLDERFDLIFALVNTFFLLERQREQSLCLQNVAHMLKSDGVLVIEGFRPGAADAQVTADGIRAIYDHELETKLGRKNYKVQLLYQETGELDRLAMNVGLVLNDRWSDWQGNPYQTEVGSHVSVYTKKP